MSLMFEKLRRGGSVPATSRNKAFLLVDNWDDHNFKTLFTLTVFDEAGVKYEIGNVKIGYFEQIGGRTEEKISSQFRMLEDNFFSLGQDAEYYQNIRRLPEELATNILVSLRDVVDDEELFKLAENEAVFRTSLLRSVSVSVIHGQYRRLLSGGVLLTPFDFSFSKEEGPENAGFDLSFVVKPESKPSTNIHIIIGRNGVGKTTLLNNMVSSIMEDDLEDRGVGHFFQNDSYFSDKKLITNDYFSSVTSISFSAFDPFIPPPDRTDRQNGPSYFYIGLKKISVENLQEQGKLKDSDELFKDFFGSLQACFSLQKKREQWLEAIRKLETDINFAEMDLSRLTQIEGPIFKKEAMTLFRKMSSGHAIVLLSMTKLVETVEEKSLVLIDEPESHLHPPLLSAFVRALSDLLIGRNGVAIIATHSPVVLQEVPKSCVWKLRRSRTTGNSDRPEHETFGENVGVLTREVFGLQVSKSGFHELLENSVAEGKGYDEILAEYSEQLGFEGRYILRALVTHRESLRGDEL